ncbi:glycine cleavage system H protein [Gilbertella persicaria]|uniref:glycine cleavage system H protein n=1 Tax=Gilbertella persicaria TaxID=101096 RepID=UPI0022207D4B|nr:glycine cleavage system H protein [Gilbertella persicaria]KAI8082511.1 glycine cleavage system H protein [Gilbertella persicaria]
MAAFRGYATKRYTEDHEWISVENGVGTFGITDHAQSSLGDIVFVEIPNIGDKVKKDDQIGAVESVKAASDIYSPASGEIQEVNSEVVDDPSMVNSGAETDGWLAKIKLSDESELEGLMDEAAYKVHVQSSDSD